MINLLLALAGLTLTVPAPAQVAGVAQSTEGQPGEAEPAKAQAAESAPAQPGKTDGDDELVQSAAAMRVADWIASSGDNASLPYVIVDKNAAALFVYDAKGKPLAKGPVLIGVATGDEATPGIGSKNLAEIGPAEKTTPAGRFLAKFGLAAGKQKVLWVDYATSVALHPIPPGANKKEHRRDRMLSPTPDDNRITFGCINVPIAVYNKTVRPLFLKKGGYVYVLPDTKPIEEVFPRLLITTAVAGGASGD
jgi:hypothetical protein